jgi:hypothetical protein
MAPSTQQVKGSVIVSRQPDPRLGTGVCPWILRTVYDFINIRDAVGQASSEFARASVGVGLYVVAAGAALARWGALGTFPTNGRR